jgi:N-acetylmuramoyl-L-alanine amidase
MLPALAFAGTPAVQLFLNGKQLAAEVAPRIVEGNTVVPVRIIAEALGAKVTWDGKNRQVSVNQGATNILLNIDKPDATVNGNHVQLEVAPMIVDGSTLVPLRFVGENLGVQFTWDELTRSVFMYKKTEAAAANPDNSGASAKVTPSTDGSNAPAASTAGGAANTGANKSGTSSTDIGAAGSETNLVAVTSIELAGDQLIVKTNGDGLKPNLFHLSGPERLVMDLPYSTLDDTLKQRMTGTVGEIAVQHPIAKKIRYSIFSSDPSTVRIIIDLKQRAELSEPDLKTANQIAVAVKAARFKVVIDAGHGGRDSGAVSVTGRYEKTFTLSMAQKVYELLKKEPQIEALLTRSDDTFIPLDDRVSFANDAKADLFLSIHGNKYTASSTGTETYYNRDESLDFAKVVHKHVTAAAGLPDRGVRQADYRVIKYTTMPAVLVEVGYLSNKGDEQKMFDEAFQNQVAASIVAAIKEYLNIK